MSGRTHPTRGVAGSTSKQEAQATLVLTKEAPGSGGSTEVAPAGTSAHVNPGILHPGHFLSPTAPLVIIGIGIGSTEVAPAGTCLLTQVYNT